MAVWRSGLGGFKLQGELQGLVIQAVLGFFFLGRFQFYPEGPSTQTVRF